MVAGLGSPSTFRSRETMYTVTEVVNPKSHGWATLDRNGRIVGRYDYDLLWMALHRAAELANYYYAS